MSPYRRHVTAAVVLSVLLRVRFVFTPLTDDEGVLLTASQVWRRGGVPYRDVWFDRPQGALVLYRFVSPSSLRWIAAGAAAVLVLAVAVAARSIAGAVAVRRSDLVPSADRVAAIAALVTAVVSVSPSWLGFAAGPVLIGLTFAVLALSLSIQIITGRLGGWASVVAGVCCGAAISLDLFTAWASMIVPIWLIAAAIGRRRRRAAVSTLRLVGVGASVVLAPLAVHAVELGTSSWWQAVVGARSRRDDPQQWLLLVPLLAVVAGLLIGRLQRASWRALAITVLLAPTAWSFGARVFRHDVPRAESVGRWIASHSDPGERVYVLCSGAATYAFAGRDPALPYLTAADLRRAGAAPMSVVSVLTADNRPELVALFDLPAECGSPSLVGVLAEFYVEETVVDGVVVLRAAGG